MAETYKDIKRQLEAFTYGNPLECECFEHRAGCEGCPAEGAYCDRKMVIHLAKRVRKATKRELNIKAIESLGFPSLGNDALADWVEEHGGIDELDKRLMPEGMEWPRFEDGEKVNYGDYIMHDGKSERVQGIYLYDSTITLSLVGVDHEKLHTVEYGERVKRPEPEVLGADGLPIKVGETVYNGTGNRHVVVEVDTDRALVEFDGETKRGWLASFITHTPPDTQERINAEIISGYRDRICPQLEPYTREYCTNECDCNSCLAERVMEQCDRQRDLCAKGGE